MVRDSAHRFGDSEAVVEGDRRVGFAELSALVSGAARALAASGIEPGDHVAVWAPNSLEWIVSALAVTTAGGVLVPVNTRFRGAEAGYVLGRSRARALFTVRGFLDTDYLALLSDAGVELPALEHIVVLPVPGSPSLAPAPAATVGQAAVAAGDADDGSVGWQEFLGRGD